MLSAPQGAARRAVLRSTPPAHCHSVAAPRCAPQAAARRVRCGALRGRRPAGLPLLPAGVAGRRGRGCAAPRCGAQVEAGSARVCPPRCPKLCPGAATHLPAALPCWRRCEHWRFGPGGLRLPLASADRCPLPAFLLPPVITEDSDLVAYGCRRVLFKMDGCGGGGRAGGLAAGRGIVREWAAHHCIAGSASARAAVMPRCRHAEPPPHSPATSTACHHRSSSRAGYCQELHLSAIPPCKRYLHASSPTRAGPATARSCSWTVCLQGLRQRWRPLQLRAAAAAAAAAVEQAARAAAAWCRSRAGRWRCCRWVLQWVVQERRLALLRRLLAPPMLARPSVDPSCPLTDPSDSHPQAACVLAGCDFLPSLRGVSFRTAAAFVARRRSLDGALKALRLEKRFQLLATAVRLRSPCICPALLCSASFALGAACARVTAWLPAGLESIGLLLAPRPAMTPLPSGVLRSCGAGGAGLPPRPGLLPQHARRQLRAAGAGAGGR